MRPTRELYAYNDNPAATRGARRHLHFTSQITNALDTCTCYSHRRAHTDALHPNTTYTMDRFGSRDMIQR